MRQRPDFLGRDPRLEAVGIIRFQHQGRDDRGEIGIAAALAEPVQRALDLARTGAHRGERIGDRLLGVVMGMNADIGAWHVLDHVTDDGLDLMWHGAAVGVAQHHPARTGLVGRPGAGEREIGVLLKAVEKVLAVDHHLAACGLCRVDAVADGSKVLLIRGLKRDADMIALPRDRGAALVTAARRSTLT